MLDFTNMSKESIQVFLDNVDITLELDALQNYTVNADGEVIEDGMEVTGSSGYISLYVFDYGFSDVLPFAVKELYVEALRCYKEAKFDSKETGRLFEQWLMSTN